MLTNNSPARLLFQCDSCLGTPNQVNYLEHVEVLVTISYPIRGHLEIDLISPSGIFFLVLCVVQAFD